MLRTAVRWGVAVPPRFVVKVTGGWSAEDQYSPAFVCCEVGAFRSIGIGDSGAIDLLDRPASAYILEKKRMMTHWTSYITRSIWQIEAALLIELRKYHKLCTIKIESMFAGSGQAEKTQALRDLTFPGEIESSDIIAEYRLQKQYLKDWATRLEAGRVELSCIEEMDHGLPHSSLRTRGYVAYSVEMPSSQILCTVKGEARVNRAMSFGIEEEPVEEAKACLEEKDQKPHMPDFIGLDAEMVNFLINF